MTFLLRAFLYFSALSSVLSVHHQPVDKHSKLAWRISNMLSATVLFFISPQNNFSQLKQLDVVAEQQAQMSIPLHSPLAACVRSEVLVWGRASWGNE